MIKSHLGLFFQPGAGTRQDGQSCIPAARDAPQMGLLSAQHCSAPGWFPASIPSDNVPEDGTCSSVSFSGLFQVRFKSLFLLLEQKFP